MRTYAESVKKWGLRVGVPAGSIITLVFAYLIMSGAIVVTSYSTDVVCEGTEDDPCYAYINFTAKEDIFIYPIDYDPWGRSEAFNFDPGVKSWLLQRSWGKGWRTIPLDKSCTGTWCGLSNNKDKRKFSVVFRKNKDYNIRIVVYKYQPYQSIKWSAFDGEVDPVFLSNNVKFIGKDKFERVCVESFVEDSETLKYECDKVRRTPVLKNVTTFVLENMSWNTNIEVSYKEEEYVGECSRTVRFNKSVSCAMTGEVLRNDVLVKENNYFCAVDTQGIICDEYRDGLGGGADGNGDGICTAGETCIRK